MENGNRKQILVVDNSPVIVKLLTHTLSAAGHAVETAENGLEALEILEEYRPDIIFTDLIMPKIDGHTLCQVVRSRPEFDQTVVVVLSAVAAEQKLDYHQLGADVCIAKGPAKAMKEHVLSVLTTGRNRVEARKVTEIIGLEGVYKREITTELLSAKNHFEITLENMTDGFVEITRSAKIIYVNRRGAELLDRPKEQLISTDFYSHFDREYRQRLVRCVKQLKEEPVEIGEDELIALKGERVLLKFIAVKEKSQDSVIVMVRDISRRKRLERQIREHLHHLEQNISRRTAEYLKINGLLHEEIKEHALANEEMATAMRQLTAVFESTDELVAIVDDELRIIKVNRAFGGLWGKQPTYFIGGNLLDSVDQLARSQLQSLFDSVAMENRKLAASVENVFPDQTARVVCAPYSDERGMRLGYVLIVRLLTTGPSPSISESGQSV